MNHFYATVVRHCRRYCKLTDLVEIVLLLLAAVLAINTVSVSGWLAIVVGALYLGLLVVKYFLTIQDRRFADRLQGEVLWGLFELLNKEVFQSDPFVRFTLFRLDPADRDFIVPWYRYSIAAGHHPINAAQKSRARYRRGEGYTGMAWAHAQNDFQIAILPTFEDRPAFEHHYSSNLNIPADIVRGLSNYMMEVGVILSCVITEHDRLLGVLSIDLQWQCTQYDPPEFEAPDGTPRHLAPNSLACIAILVNNALRSFESAESRRW